MSYQDIFRNMNIDSVLEPARRYNALVVNNAEKLLSMQLDAARSYTDLGIKQVRDAMEITDVSTLQDYLGNQAEVAKTLAERAQKDVRSLTELGQSFANDLQGLMQENVASAAGQGKSAKNRAAASTTASGASQPSTRKSA
jgi:phasin family protein